MAEKNFSEKKSSFSATLCKCLINYIEGIYSINQSMFVSALLQRLLERVRFYHRGWEYHRRNPDRECRLPPIVPSRQAGQTTP